MAYVKPWMSYQDQLTQLISRGLIVTDQPKALSCLERIGYYRLSGYWYPFRDRSGSGSGQTVLDSFKVGSTFENAVNLYIFDKELRLLALDALERIEIALRVDISHLLGKYSSFAYWDPSVFHRTFSQDIDPQTGITKHHTWLTKHGQLINRSKEEFVKHNKSKYGLPLAIWVACEVWDFGTMSTLYNGLAESDQDIISTKYGISNGRIFASWLRSLNYLRNVCAHHSRLWNRNIVDQARLPPEAEVPWVLPFVTDNHARARCFLLFWMARHLLQVINPTSTWANRVKLHMLSFPDLTAIGLDLNSMGVVPGWETQWP